jgi:hypothetical protein
MISVSTIVRFFMTPCNQRNYKNQACNQKEDAGNQAERIPVLNTRCDEKTGTDDEKYPAPQLKFQVSFSTRIRHKGGLLNQILGLKAVT